MRLIELVLAFLAVTGSCAYGGYTLWTLVHKRLRLEAKQDELDKELRF